MYFAKLSWRKAPNEFSTKPLPTPHPSFASQNPPSPAGEGKGAHKFMQTKWNSVGCAENGGRQVASPTNYLLFYANIYFPRNFLRSSAGGRLPPLQIILLFYADKYIPHKFLHTSADRRGRRSLQVGVFKMRMNGFRKARGCVFLKIPF